MFRLRLQRAATTIDTALMPLPIWLAHRMAEEARRGPQERPESPISVPTARPQVTIAYEDGRPVGIDTILISAQHQPEVDIETLLKPDLLEYVVKPVIPDVLWSDGIRFLVNPNRPAFEVGGPQGPTPG